MNLDRFSFGFVVDFKHRFTGKIEKSRNDIAREGFGFYVEFLHDRIIVFP
ncbi:hypothetical protein SDC9_196045 [bioreactor metagenome]|uniref:Uncharacterized protein n=1 Tax=bioreactor metagenome TaxID=1076179 RepID=A0A645IAZ0_9ZZZZ